MTWHVPESALLAYIDGSTGDVAAWSVETHLIDCETCRRRSAAAASAAGTEAAAIVQQARENLPARLPAQGRIRRAGGYRRIVVLAMSGPAAHAAWLLAMAVVLTMSVALDVSGARIGEAGAPGGVPWLTLVAPLIPVIGVAAVYDSGLDGAGEIIASAPSGGLRLLLYRTLAVLIVVMPASLVAGMTTAATAPAGWLLPSLALTALTLAVGSATGVAPAAVVVGLAWVSVVAGPTLAPDVGRAVVSTADAGVWLALTLVSGAAVAWRSGSFARPPLRSR